MVLARREHQGGAVATVLTSGINASDTSISLSSATNWPTGSTGSFYIVIDRTQVGEERILCSSRSGTTLTVAGSGRGKDGTSAAAHSTSAVVEHVLVAEEVDDDNAHVYDTSRDDHTQYMKDPTSATDPTGGSTTSTTFTGTGFATLAVTVTTGTSAIVVLTGTLSNAVANQVARMGYVVSGASTVAADTTKALILGGVAGVQNAGSFTAVETGLTAGSNVFTVKYNSSNGASSASFTALKLTVVPL